ncbi:MAG: cell division protein FtsX [Bacteroidia bacterium]
MAEEGNKLARKALRSSYISTVVSISLVLFLIGTLGVLVMNAKIISDYFKENFQLSMLMKPSASEQEIKSFLITLNSSEAVKSAVLVTKEEAAKKLSEELGGEDFVSFLEYNPLPITIDVNFKADYASNSLIDGFIKTFTGNGIVDDVWYQHSRIDLINKNLQAISFVILVFSTLLFFIAGVLINNTIRLSLYAKRLLIKSMQLVGATRGFIRAPFIKSGMISGFYSAVIANVLLAGLLYLAQREVPEIFGLQDFKYLAIIVVSVIILGILISATSTYFAVNNYLRKSYDELF